MKSSQQRDTIMNLLTAINYKEYYDASWENKPMKEDYVIVTFKTNDNNYLKYVYSCFYDVEWDCFYRGNKEWVVIGQNKETIEKWAEQFTKSGCQVIVTAINKM